MNGLTEFAEFMKKYFSNTKVYDMILYSIQKRSKRIPAEQQTPVSLSGLCLG
ncbi:hypothetical protein [Diplocloster agilis]|uniref:Uncharacterized protein n=1 Tax=Diplocloster agilis TaxID=2850323 RepID=A0A949K0T6_9FIRM|nr:MULTISPECIES: hypothetical protein [Lachnospiraceae]MBU9737634.1 hypothetical protein [Diplocloster agilis]MBU9743992.1 hypothetical protein [Diplocloster agilis]MCU6736740.1 hypothetical protein [Suonthocola fibrivorans]SCJ93299.1 Uncharacterised protein [uncultured Clostridium sp.]